jgi:hypothetical protein
VPFFAAFNAARNSVASHQDENQITRSPDQGLAEALEGQAAQRLDSEQLHQFL